MEGEGESDPWGHPAPNNCLAMPCDGQLARTSSPSYPFPACSLHRPAWEACALVLSLAGLCNEHSLLEGKVTDQLGMGTYHPLTKGHLCPVAEAKGSGVPRSGDYSMTLLLTRWVTSGQVHQLSGPQFPHL